MRSTTAVAVFLALTFCAAPAYGAFPGQNGRIAYDDNNDIHTVNPDGTGHLQLTTTPGFDFGAEWSPNGTRIAFTSDRDGLGAQVYLMNADGTNQTRLTDPPGQAGGPAWSPDGNRLVFSRGGDLWVMNADGTGGTVLASLPTTSDGAADWSPDGSRIAFLRDFELWLIRADGTGLTQLTSVPPFPQTTFGAPDWSPDGSRITYVVSYEADGEYCADLVTLRADGSGGTTVLPATCESGVSSNNYGDPGWSPDGLRIATRDFTLLTVRVDGTDQVDVGGDAYTADWQPLPADQEIARHVRPKGATPFRVPLVPATRECTASNRTHGPPLAFPSCSPPVPGSPRLTVGVGDGSSALARSSGFVRLDVRAGAAGPPNDADVFIRFSLTNVMRVADLSEYTGELRPELTVRRTDADLGPNTGGSGVGPRSTSIDFPFGFPVTCSATPGSSLDASICAVSTSMNALIPNAIWEFNRNVWALDKVRVYDGGPDEDADTTGDNSLFMTQGVFVP